MIPEERLRPGPWNQKLLLPSGDVLPGQPQSPLSPPAWSRIPQAPGNAAGELTTHAWGPYSTRMTPKRKRRPEDLMAQGSRCRRTLGSQSPGLPFRRPVLMSSSDWPSVWEPEGIMGVNPEWAEFSHLKQLTNARRHLPPGKRGWGGGHG